jgi:hypothetical protein
MKKSLFPFIMAAVMGLLLFYPSLSLKGAETGLLLWFHTVLPTLLPFMLCSSAIVAFGAVPSLTRPLSPLFSCLSFSENGSYALMAGILCGYPMGPKTTADFLAEGKISEEEGRYLLAVSAWPSPMFLAGYLAVRLPSSIPFPRVLFCIYLPAFLIASLARAVYRVPKLKNWKQSQTRAVKTSEQLYASSFDEILMDCLEIMAKIGGYLMIFSIFAEFVTAFLPKEFFLRPYLLGLIEMTTGIREMTSSGHPALVTGVGMMGAAVFGGLSGIFQVSAVIQKNAGLSIRHYVLWKLIHLLFSTALFILLSLAG